LSEVYQPVCDQDQLEKVFAAGYDDDAYTTNQDPYKESTTAYVYDPDYNCSSDTPSPQSLTSHVFYDGLGRRIQSQSQDDGSEYIISYRQFDKLGRVVTESVPTGLSSGFGSYQTSPGDDGLTLSQYDPLGRPTQVTAPDDSQTTFYYFRDNHQGLGYGPTQGYNCPKTSSGFCKGFLGKRPEVILRRLLSGIILWFG